MNISVTSEVNNIFDYLCYHCDELSRPVNDLLDYVNEKEMISEFNTLIASKYANDESVERDDLCANLEVYADEIRAELDKAKATALNQQTAEQMIAKAMDLCNQAMQLCKAIAV